MIDRLVQDYWFTRNSVLEACNRTLAYITPLTSEICGQDPFTGLERREPVCLALSLEDILSGGWMNERHAERARRGEEG